MARAILTLAFLALAACSGGGSPTPAPTPAPPPVVTPPPVTGATWRARFDAIDQGTRDPYAASTDSGKLAFGERGNLEAYIAMFKATGERKYLDAAAHNIDLIFVTASHPIIAGNIRAGDWGFTSAGYSTDHKPYPFMLHDGNILSAVANWILTVNANQPALIDLKSKADVWTIFLGKWRHRWDAEWRAACGCFVQPAWQTHYAGVPAGWSMPLNMTEMEALYLYRYDKIVGDPDARAKAIAVAVTLKATFRPTPDGRGIVWPYAAHLLPTDGARYTGSAGVTDTSHANYDLTFILELAHDGIVFTDADIAAIAHTFTLYTYDAPTHSLHTYLLSGALTADNVSAFAALAEHAPAIPGIVRALIDKPGTLFGGSTERLAIAELARFDRGH